MKKEILRRDRMAEVSGIHVREKKDGGDSRTICGRAIVFDTPSVILAEGDDWEIREIIAPEAVTRELLDASDIKMTMFHNRQLILARSNKGKGTLRYDVREDGVHFEFDAPRTADGDKALELVSRGDLAGCSFAFLADYSDRQKVERSCKTENGREVQTYTVRQVEAILDFTLAADPAYEETDVKVLRELISDSSDPAAEAAEDERRERAEAQYLAMKKKASYK